ncbi:MAG: PHP domain-containing protein [Candidatus Aenigmatarchaeota archaeon]
MSYHDLHVHTDRSDGNLSPESLIKTARNKWIEVIGFSDHAFTRKLQKDMQITLFEKYLGDIRELQKSYGDICIKAGLEIDSSYSRTAVLKNLPFEVLNRFDYVLFENVEVDPNEHGIGSLDEIIAIRKKLLIPVGLAHNRLQYKLKSGNEARIIAYALEENDIFIELNQPENISNSLRTDRNYLYFTDELIKYMKESCVRFTIGTDTHIGNGLGVTYDAEAFVSRHNLHYHDTLTRKLD